MEQMDCKLPYHLLNNPKKVSSNAKQATKILRCVRAIQPFWSSPHPKIHFTDPRKQLIRPRAFIRLFIKIHKSFIGCWGRSEISMWCVLCLAMLLFFRSGLLNAISLQQFTKTPSQRGYKKKILL